MVNQDFIISALIVAILGLSSKIIYDWLSSDRKKKCSSAECESEHETIKSITYSVKRDTAWLKEAHDCKDDSGRPLWFVPASLKELAIKSSESAIRNEEHLKRIVFIYRCQAHVWILKI